MQPEAVATVTLKKTSPLTFAQTLQPAQEGSYLSRERTVVPVIDCAGWHTNKFSKPFLR
jgi:hypothetical protein